jgi:aspartate/tyrosine/aromatic aminotransferase
MMGIYTDSPSIVSVVVKNMDEKAKVDSQLRVIAREMYLHPSPWGAHVVHAILSNPKLYTAWYVFSSSLGRLLIHRLNEIKAMADRLRSVRDKLFDVIANKLKTPGQWLHIKRATGMYW